MKKFIEKIIIVNLAMVSLVFGSVKTDKYGKNFYTTKEEESYHLFKWIRGNKVPLFAKPSRTSNHLRLLDVQEFVEIINEQELGGHFSKVKVYDPRKGFVIGYVSNAKIFDKKYYGTPYELTPEEIARKKEYLEELEKRKKANRKKLIKFQEKENLRIISAKARADQENVFGMSFNEIGKYMKEIGYKVDKTYLETAFQTVKFQRDHDIVYFTMKDGQVVGLLHVNNDDGFSKEDMQVALYEYAGEIYYDISESKKINGMLEKTYGTLKNSKRKLVLKTDNTKGNPYIEIAVGEFSGIE